MINWEEQWASFAPGFKCGKAHVELPNGETIQLLPGPGFGDFSHPTTQVMVALMAKVVPNQIVFDIGCGSGILSLAAAKMGAKKVFACDIDPDSVDHTKKNGTLNEITIGFNSPFPFPQKPVVLMNMIASEQALAWAAHGCDFDILITSGILESGRNSYLQFASSNDWKLTHEQELDGWLGFIFHPKEATSP